MATALNDQMTTGINEMYDAKKRADITSLDNAYNQNVANANQQLEKIPQQYQERANQLGAAYEQQRRNNNMAASFNGMSTGARTQQDLAQSGQYAQNTTDLAKDELDAIEQQNNKILDLGVEYERNKADTSANDDYKKQQALIEEQYKEYERQENQAKTASEFGDFSGYANLYGQEAADNMAKSWALQNPDVAWSLGKITKEEYFKMTGKNPR